jgi:hypothetical protein
MIKKPRYKSFSDILPHSTGHRAQESASLSIYDNIKTLFAFKDQKLA